MSPQDASIPDFLLEDVPELPEEFAAYPEPPPRRPAGAPRELRSRSSREDRRLRMKRKRSGEHRPRTALLEPLPFLRVVPTPCREISPP